MEYLFHKHHFIQKSKDGGYGLVTFRNTDGTRNIIQEMRYFRIFKYEIFETTLLIYNIVTGLNFKGKEIKSASSTLYLSDLLQINVYDYGSQFFTNSGLDFAYVSDDKFVKIKLLRTWIDNESAILRAQWRNKDRDLDSMLFNFGKQVTQVQKSKRFLVCKHNSL